MLNAAIGHGLSLATILGWVVGALPPIATLLAIVWYCAMLHDWYVARRDRKKDPTP